MKVSKKIINLETESAFAILAKATNLIKEGKDITVVSYGSTFNICEAAAKQLEQMNISCE